MSVIGPIVVMFEVFCVQEVGARLPMSVVGPIVVMFVVFSCSGGWCLTSNACGRAHCGPVCGFLCLRLWYHDRNYFRRLVPDYQCLWSGPSWPCL